MVHVLYIMIHIFCPRKNLKSGNVMQPLTGPYMYVYGVNRRSENFLLLSDLLVA